MRCLLFALVAFSYLPTVMCAEKLTYTEEIQMWRKVREEKLRADNGWLTLAGRFTLKDGANTFGTGESNDVVCPAVLEGTGPKQLGVIHIDSVAKKVTLKLAAGVSMTSGGKAFTGERVLGTSAEKRDWVGLERLSLHVIERGGKYTLRLADNGSDVRRKFAGCVWYAADEAYKVEAKFVPYPEGKTLSIVNVIDEVSKQRCPGYAEFQLKGATYKLDAIKDGDGLLFVFRDDTAGDTTYKPGRFVDADRQPKANETFTLDFNKAYNPPCAWTDYATCPLPPSQNVLKTRIEAGEKSRAKR
ncbi:DUF1684 domain-containing protein [Gemmata sp. JC717]|uniref:DUF1684 domain-containing protein n=1 Tax=Gemmata algarum TaxID=2975278 RepID=UPI0021BA9787|nr:DUF1684 domain-containing protein [Gemmata algarum]MDY3555026.1 DUF1684 domain-containing protein [Gemmata algarum]